MDPLPPGISKGTVRLFLEQLRSILDEMRSIISHNGEVGAARREQFKRELHTLKGGAGFLRQQCVEHTVAELYQAVDRSLAEGSLPVGAIKTTVPVLEREVEGIHEYCESA